MRRLNNGPGAIRDLVGHIDHVNIWEVRGWCGDEAGAGEDLVIEIFVDTMFVGTVSCDQLRPDVQRLLGGNGIYGFTFSFSASHLDLFQVDRWISAREQTTKRTFGRILFPRSSHPEESTNLPGFIASSSRSGRCWIGSKPSCPSRLDNSVFPSLPIPSILQRMLSVPRSG